MPVLKIFLLTLAISQRYKSIYNEIGY